MVGHFDLFLSRLGRERMLFRCATCSSLWTRTSRSGQPLVWQTTEIEIDGIEIPGLGPPMREKTPS